MKDDYILIVDDELPIREMIHTSLDMAGFQCLQAEDAKQAHQMIVDQRPALILLDWSEVPQHTAINQVFSKVSAERAFSVSL